MKLFSVHFRDEVTPRLRNLARAEAHCVAHGAESFSGAWDAVMNYARAHGALYLPDAILHELEDWISTTLLDAITEAEGAGGQ